MIARNHPNRKTLEEFESIVNRYKVNIPGLRLDLEDTLAWDTEVVVSIDAPWGNETIMHFTLDRNESDSSKQLLCYTIDDKLYNTLKSWSKYGLL